MTADPAELILSMTREIWEDRAIHSLKRHYAPDLRVRSPAGTLTGADTVIAATLATLAEFPDRALLGEDVIWTGTREAFLSSHRLLCTATHDGPGPYGAPTGRQLTYRILADCYVRGGQVADEWLVRDQAAIVRQMGWSVTDWTRDAITRAGGAAAAPRPFKPATDRLGPYDGAGDADPWGDRLAELISGAMAGGFGAISSGYDRAAHLSYPDHLTAHGPAGAASFWLGLRAALPDAAFAIHHRTGRHDPDGPPRAAIRWSLDGPHAGPGRFGDASGAALHVMGITHAEFGPRGLRREWTLIDDTAVWTQILLSTGMVD